MAQTSIQFEILNNGLTVNSIQNGKNTICTALST